MRWFSTSSGRFADLRRGGPPRCRWRHGVIRWGRGVARPFIARIAESVQPAPLRFSIDPSKQTPISRFIYGANFVESRSWDFARHFPPFTLVRIGGNRLSAYNWENNFSNAGNDYLYENDDYLSDSRKPGEAVGRESMPRAPPAPRRW